MGPKFRRKLFEICCVLTCCILSLIMIPMIFANVVGNIITAPTEWFHFQINIYINFILLLLFFILKLILS